MRVPRRFAMALAVAAALGGAVAVVAVDELGSAGRAGTSTSGGAWVGDPPITTTSDPKPGE
ncbi:hypothetical protein [Actinosynnema sp. NPDC023587]|uniref:hypothetical protein n=1 Tax=Actinosynnema sp. NPDC023587 TaxID=3154695 RepID=UPI0033F0B97D